MTKLNETQNKEIQKVLKKQTPITTIHGVLIKKIDSTIPTYNLGVLSK